MNRFISCFLAFYFVLGSLLPASDFEEFGKIGAMLHHFEEHQIRSNFKLDFIEFLRLHYDDVKHHKSENHTQLPLKQHTFHIVQYFAFEKIQLHTKALSYSFRVSYPFKNEQSIFNTPHTVWQPPKITVA